MKNMFDTHEQFLERNLRKHSRSVLILGEKNQKKLTESTVTIAGLGAVGTSIFEILVRQGVGRIIGIDPDLTVEDHNLDRQFLYREKDIGKPKALLAKENAREINSDVEVIPYVGKFSDAIKSSLSEVIKYSDLLISGIDNRLGRYSVSRFSYVYNIPHLDGATGGFNCRAYVFPEPRKGPCYLCTLTKKDYEEISKIFSCTRREGNNFVAPAIVQTGVQVATILAMEAIKILIGFPVRYNEIRVNLMSWSIMKGKLDPTKGHREGHIFL
jgi:adenylyltransferase/sulfurtransferase